MTTLRYCAVCEQDQTQRPSMVLARWQDQDICTDCLETRPGKEEAEAEAREERRQPMTQQAYREAGGSCCPFCPAGDVEGTSLTVDEGIVAQACVCRVCDAEWTDYYRLAGYVRDEQPGGKEDWEAFLDTVIVETGTTDEHAA